LIGTKAPRRSQGERSSLISAIANHPVRMIITDDLVTSNAYFERQLEAMDKAPDDAGDHVRDAKPHAFILGVSAPEVGGR
jgi:maleate isomerase